MENEKDQVGEDIRDDETSTEQSSEEDEKSSETTNEPEITPERAYELARGLQKGYTLTRQELSEIRENLSAVQEALEELKSQKEDYSEVYEEERPLTRKELLQTLAEWEQKKAVEQEQKAAQVDQLIEDLKMEGLVKDDKEADDLIKFVVDSAKAAGLKSISPDYILSVYPAWEKVREANLVKEQEKVKARREEGSKVGTSEKARPNEQGVSYTEIHSRDWDEL